MTGVIGLGGEVHDETQTSESDSISFSLEALYLFTLILMIVSGYFLLKVGTIKRKEVLYRLLLIGFTFLTLDYLVFKYLL